MNRRVVGVVGGVRYFGLDRGVDAEMYMPIRRRVTINPSISWYAEPFRRPRLPQAFARRSDSVDPNLPIIEFRTMEQLVDRSVFARRFTVLLVAGFAAFGLILSCLGIYAVISYSVSQRTQEIGIRMALGATPARLRTTIFGETGVLVVLGVIARATGIVDGESRDPGAAVRRGLLGPRDVRGRAGGSCPCVAVLAGYVPARRATQVDPAIALRPQ